MARMIWMGRWDPKRDREPTKKDEQAFKEFLRDKYDRKKWYRDPSEVKKDIASKSPDATPTSPPTSLPTPPTQVINQQTQKWTAHLSIWIHEISVKNVYCYS